MIFDKLSEVPESNQIIIIGSGPAGITLAVHLEKKGIPSIIFEAGSIDQNDESQNFYKGITIGDDYPDLSLSRLRQFGGTSGHWGGNCIELDHYDFNSWPINKNDLKNFKEISYETLNIKGNFFKKNFNQDIDLINLNWSNVRFKEKYFEKIKKSKKISLILDCPLINFNGENGVVKSASFLSKKSLRKIKGKFFILATGGIENSRLLLWTREKNPNLISNSLPIGNYWMDHPYHSVAEGVLFKKNFDNYLNKNNLHKYIDTNCNYSFFFSPKRSMIENFGLLNTSINIGIFTKENQSKENLFVKQLKCMAPSLFKKYLFNENNLENYNFNINLLSDQEPLFDNKIILDKKTDPNGVPMPILYWKRSNKVRESSRKIVESIAKFLVEKNLGRLAADDFLFSNKAYRHQNGYHHMGGTKMGESIKSSVVDKNLRVHDTKNLFVSGSSVFVTAGHAYPTLTITQLSLRLAEHINKLIK